MPVTPTPLANYPATGTTTASRGGDRATWDRATIHAILDATPVCHLGYVTDGRPVVIPTTFARIDESVVVHASTGARAARHATNGAAHDGVDVCLTVTIVDGFVLARSAFHHSMNYRSVVVRGVARPVTDPASKRVMLAAIVDKVWPERSRNCRPPNARELAATTVLELPLAEVSAKVRGEGANDEPADLDGPWWAGVVPVRTVLGTPEPNHDLAPDISLP